MNGRSPKLPVELDQAQGKIVEPPVRLLAVLVQHERIHLLLKKLDVGGERQHVLNGAVVEIEPEAHQAPFRRGDERSLAGGRVLEKVLPLDDGAELCRNLDEIGVGNLRLHRAEMTHDRRIHPAEAKHRNRAQLRPAEQGEARTPAKSRLRLGAHASRRASVGTETDDALDPLRAVGPQRDVREHVEAEQQPELDLDGHERR